jgi:hypothetical protein
VKSDERLETLSLLLVYASERGIVGKKAAQKLVHLLQERSDLELGYRFSFYNFGAFSRDLAADLDTAAKRGYLSVRYIPESNFYSITRGPKFSDELQASIERKAKSEIMGAVRPFFGETARWLELLSTIQFVITEERIVRTDMKRLKKRVLELKPKYGSAEFDKAYTELFPPRKTR